MKNNKHSREFLSGVLYGINLVESYDEGRNNEVDMAVFKAREYFDKLEQEFNRENANPIGYGIKINGKGWTEPFPYYHSSEVVDSDNYWVDFEDACEAAEHKNKRNHS